MERGRFCSGSGWKWGCDEVSLGRIKRDGVAGVDFPRCDSRSPGVIALEPAAPPDSDLTEGHLPGDLRRNFLFLPGRSLFSCHRAGLLGVVRVLHQVTAGVSVRSLPFRFSPFLPERERPWLRGSLGRTSFLLEPSGGVRSLGRGMYVT